MYKLFLYKTTGVIGSAPCIWSTNRTLEENTFDAWKRNCTEDNILNFDVQKVKKDIETLLAYSDSDTFKIQIKSSPNKRIEYICVVASYNNIKSVISVVHSVAVRNNLVMYDSVKKRSFHYKDLSDVDFVMMRQRIAIINNAIQRFIKPLFRIRKLGSYDGTRDKFADYVVTLRKANGIPFEKRIESFYELLKSVLIKEEKLVTSNRCFTIVGDFYEISYTLEAYRKRADRIGYISDNKPCAELTRRMSCETAVDWAKNNMTKSYEKYDYCMYVTEMVQAFPNPADRFVKGINIKKQIQKEKFHYTYCGYYGGAIDFNAVFPHNTYEAREISNLSIDEDDAAPLLNVISKFYPYFSDRYYESNHLPSEMMRDIIMEMKKVRDLIINDFDSEELKPYIKNKYGFYALAYYCDEYNKKLFDENWRDFLYRHRYEAVRIYDVFIEWAESQLNAYDITGEGLMFNVEGP